MFGDSFVAVLVVRVPRIDVFPLSESGRARNGFVVGLVGELQGPVEPAQHVDGRRMYLAMHHDVAGIWKRIVHPDSILSWQDGAVCSIENIERDVKRREPIHATQVTM
jgi:hypothetical protein